MTGWQDKTARTSQRAPPLLESACFWQAGCCVPARSHRQVRAEEVPSSIEHWEIKAASCYCSLSWKFARHASKCDLGADLHLSRQVRIKQQQHFKSKLVREQAARAKRAGWPLLSCCSSDSFHQRFFCALRARYIPFCSRKVTHS